MHFTNLGNQPLPRLFRDDDRNRLWSERGRYKGVIGELTLKPSANRFSGTRAFGDCTDIPMRAALIVG